MNNNHKKIIKSGKSGHHCLDPVFHSDGYEIDKEHKRILYNGETVFMGIYEVAGFYRMKSVRGNEIPVAEILVQLPPKWKCNVSAHSAIRLDAPQDSLPFLNDHSYDASLIIPISDLIQGDLPDEFFNYVMTDHVINKEIKRMICDSILHHRFLCGEYIDGYLLDQGSNRINGKEVCLAGDIIINGDPDDIYFYTVDV